MVGDNGKELITKQAVFFMLSLYLKSMNTFIVPVAPTIV
jgi:hypothetical protein